MGNGLVVGMAWAWVVIVVIAVGLPVGAWRLSRNLKPQRHRAGHLGAGRIDRWLAEHYQLSALDRWRIEETIFRDALQAGRSPAPRGRPRPGR